MTHKTAAGEQDLSDDEHAKRIPLCWNSEKTVDTVCAAVAMESLHGHIREQHPAESRSALFHVLVIPQRIEQHTYRRIHDAASRDQSQGAEREGQRARPGLDGRAGVVQRHAVEGDVH